MRWALWDMGRRSPDHDILIFIHAALIGGAEGVWFTPGFNYIKAGSNKETYKDEVTESERQRTILFDACELYGVPYGIGTSPREGYFLEEVFSRPGAIQGFDEFLKPRIPDWAYPKAMNRLAGRKIAVSMRVAGYNQARNSSDDWYKWAEQHDACVVPDYTQEKISLFERAAIYEMAKLNIGVMQGPMVLNWLSKNPYLIVKMIQESCKVSTERYYEKKFKLPKGTQFRQATKAQRMVWNDRDDLETIEMEYQSYLKSHLEAQ